MRVLVTGAAGFLGSHAVAGLRAHGHDVVAHARRIEQFVCGSGRSREALGEDAVETLRGFRRSHKAADLARDPLEPLVDGCDAVIHCAARSSPWGRAQAFEDANVLATERLLAACTRSGVRRFVHIGSPSIYFRFADQLDVREPFTAPDHWITDYARTKWESECRVRDAATAGMQARILRPRAVFGPGDNAILPRLLAVAARGWFPLVHGGRALIDVTCVDNAVQAIVAALEIDGPWDGRAYNISNGAPLTVDELVTMLFDALDLDVRRVQVPRGLAVALAGVAETVARLRPGCPEPRLTRYGIGVIGYSQTLDISRARAELGYAPNVSTAAGLAQFATWWRATHARA